MTIKIKGARVNNLKNIDLEIPRDKLIVVTGLSGSGKSSLAFDTLYAEGQRRYVESLSAYSRQFLGRMHKPECDYIKGLPPAIAIEQKVTSRNPRSTVGTSTEIYEYLRLLFARIGRTFSPVSGEEVKRHTVKDVVDCALSHPAGTRFTVLAPMRIHGERTLREQLEIDLKQGLSRLDVDGEMVRIEDFLEELSTVKGEGLKVKGEGITVNEGDDSFTVHRSPFSVENIYLLLDRLAVDNSQTAISRLADSVQTAFFEGGGTCVLRFYPGKETVTFSERFEADGIQFEEPSDSMFSFNSPLGACPECEGFGRIMGIDEQLVVPNSSLSVYEGAVMCWRGDKMGEWRKEFCRRASEVGFPIFEPYYNLTQEQKDYLWHGDGKVHHGDGDWDVCIDRFFDMLRENQYKIQYRVMLARYRGKTECPTCRGSRLKKQASYVKVGGKNITELVRLSIRELQEFFASLTLQPHEEQVAARLLAEIRSRLEFLMDVGLGYLTLDRLSNTLSGGESQRINLATSLGSSLVGSLYILDEPSIGLHSRDTDRLISVLKKLRDLGNTVVIVEHDEEIIREADYIIDIGPDAGRRGGEVTFAGTLSKGLAHGDDAEYNSHTLRYLTGRESIEVPTSRRRWNNFIELKGARHNNLKGVDAKFPLNVTTVVTGVSGSGKSTLVRDIFYRALKRHFDEPCDRPGEFISLDGDLNQIKAIEFVDQNPIGKSSRSNPVTYVKAYDEIRKLMAAQPLAKQMDFTAAHFSFNTDGGRCEECKGEGTVTVEMQFMADLILECKACGGKRFKNDILEVRFADKNIHDILEMTINQAIEFFTEHRQEKIARRLKPLQDVGLGYIHLGQPSSTLSGGENQRVKLAYYLGLERTEPTLFIFDEPTTGLHFHDIKRLLRSFDALIARGHTVLIIEHNMDVIKCADHVIDLGPEGGAEGGTIIACGTPEEIVAQGVGYTARFLQEKLR